MNEISQPRDGQETLRREVFWAEAHDEAQLHLSDPSWIRRRLITMFLLSDRLVFHPSYLWRSSFTHHLQFNAFPQLFRPDFASIILGNSPSAEHYIITRTAQLTDAEQTGLISLEAQNYRRNWTSIEADAPQLDGLFVHNAAGLYSGFVGSRDRRLRELMLADLDDDGDPGSLRSVILKMGAAQSDVNLAAEVLSHLRGWVLHAPFVFREGFLFEVRQSGLVATSSEEKLALRLLDLYFRSTVAPSVQVPFLWTLQQQFDPYNPRYFETYLLAVLGKKLYRTIFFECSDQNVSHIIAGMKADPAWIEARELYFHFIAQLNTVLWQHPLLGGVLLQYEASTDGGKSVRRVVRETKLNILGTALGVLSLGALAPTLSGFAGVGGLLLSIWQVQQSLRKALDEGRGTCQYLVRRHVEDLLTTRRIPFLRYRGQATTRTQLPMAHTAVSRDVA